MKTILITGVAGFIGSNLAEVLLENYRVIGIDNFDDFYDRGIKERNLDTLAESSSFTFIEGSILDLENLYGSQDVPDCIIHLAAKAGVQPSLRSPKDYIETNIKGTQAILDFMINRKVKKLIFGSSSSVYGDSDNVPFIEDLTTDYQISPYAVTKKAGELLCRTFSHLYGLDILCLRFFTVYGPRQRPDLAIYKFFNLIERRQAIQIYGDGTMARDYTYITDTVEGIVLSLEYIFNHVSVFEIINLGNEYPVPLSDLVLRITEIVPDKVIIEHAKEQAGDVKITYANINKAKRILGYNPKISIDQGLKLFHEWYIGNK